MKKKRKAIKSTNKSNSVDKYSAKLDFKNILIKVAFFGMILVFALLISKVGVDKYSDNQLGKAYQDAYLLSTTKVKLFDSSSDITIRNYLRIVDSEPSKYIIIIGRNANPSEIARSAELAGLLGISTTKFDNEVNIDLLKNAIIIGLATSNNLIHDDFIGYESKSEISDNNNLFIEGKFEINSIINFLKTYDTNPNSALDTRCLKGNSIIFVRCKNPVCGDGILDQNEECDTGVLKKCSDFESLIAWPNPNGDVQCSNCRWNLSVCSYRCGNGIREGIEECDDGNQNNNDSCRNNCTIMPPYCTDSDGGQNIYVAGHTNGINVYFNDVCVTNQGSQCSGASCTSVAEGYCGPNGVSNILMGCPSSYCVNGACVNTTVNQTCTDSDGGINYPVFGSTVVYVNSVVTMAVNDGCYTNNTLEEHYCQNNQIALVNYACPGLCSSGACVNNTNTTNTTLACYDNDGLNYYTASWAVNYTGNFVIKTNLTDYCVNSTHLNEARCIGAGLSYLNYKCPLVCSNGACVNNTGNSTNCTDECTSGQKRCTSNYGYQQCGSYDTDSCLEWSTNISCGTGNICTGPGVCSVNQTNTSFCGDGVLNAGEECDGSGTFNSTCEAYGLRSGGAVNCDSCQINLTNCLPFSICGNGIVESPEQCDDGNQNNTDMCANNCTSNNFYSCIDPDGTNYYLKSWAANFTNNVLIANITDTCKNATHLNEARCFGTRVINPFIACPQSCIDGACVNNTVTYLDHCMYIWNPGVYKQNANIQSSVGTCFNILSSDVTIDGNGYYISGGSNIVSASGVKNITILNLKATASDDGINLQNVTNFVISNNIINTSFEILDIYLSKNGIIDNNIANGLFGIVGSSNIVISNNNMVSVNINEELIILRSVNINVTHNSMSYLVSHAAGASRITNSSNLIVSDNIISGQALSAFNLKNVTFSQFIRNDMCGLTGYPYDYAMICDNITNNNNNYNYADSNKFTISNCPWANLTRIPCSSSPVCGNGIIEAVEECDDGNIINGDGCSNNCTIEINKCGFSNTFINNISYYSSIVSFPNQFILNEGEATNEYTTIRHQSNYPDTDYFLVPSKIKSDGGRILERGYPNAGSVSLTDVITKDNFVIPIDSNGNGVTNIDGETFYLYTTYAITANYPTYRLTWGKEASFAYPGRYTDILLSPNCAIEFHAICGNAKTEFGESCDDGNNNNNDTCSNKCELVYNGPKIFNIDFGTLNTTKTGAAVVGNAGDFWNSIAGSGKFTYLRYSTYELSDINVSLIALAGSWGFDSGINDSMLNTYSYGRAVYSGQASILIEGIPDGLYDLYLYGHEGENGEKYLVETLDSNKSYGVLYTINGSAIFTTTLWVDGVQYVKFKNIRMQNSDKIKITLFPEQYYSVSAINGLQLLPSAITCGNGIIEAGEACDGSVNGFNCSEFGNFTSGNLKCTNCQYDVSNCYSSRPVVNVIQDIKTNPTVRNSFAVLLGKAASSSDSVAGVDIAGTTGIDTTILDEAASTTPSKPKRIIIGGPCVNSETSRLLGIPMSMPACYEQFPVHNGQAIIATVKDGSNEVIIVAGYSADDTRRAGRIIVENPNSLFSSYMIV